jgi:GNAT superfamily N-acetyltransferase
MGWHMIFAREKVADCMDEWRVLGNDHWNEYYQDFDFHPDENGLKEQESNGQFVYFSMRDEHGKLCGQAGFTVNYNPIFSSYVAYDSFFYIAPKHRNKNNMKKLLYFAGKNLNESGVNQVLAGHHLEQDLSSLLKGASFNPASMLYLFTGNE